VSRRRRRVSSRAVLVRRPAGVALRFAPRLWRSGLARQPPPCARARLVPRRRRRAPSPCVLAPENAKPAATVSHMRHVNFFLKIAAARCGVRFFFVYSHRVRAVGLN